MRSVYFDVENPEYCFRHLFLVEGKDDAIFLEKVFTHLNAQPSDVRIIVCKGQSQIERHFNLIVKSREYVEFVRSVSIVRDADADHIASGDFVRAIFGKKMATAPDPWQVVSFEGRKFGSYLFPAPFQNGDLEDLALSLAPSGNALSSCHEYIDSLAAENNLDKIGKRKIQAYLAGISPEIRQTVGWAFRDETIPIDYNRILPLVLFVEEILAP